MSTTRRDFLKMSLGGTALSSLGTAFFTSTLVSRSALAAPQAAGGDTVLIVVQMSGGNDGLNTVVPYADDEYGRSRFTLRLGAKQVLKIDDHLGFHPKMQAFKRLYDEGHLTIVQGVAYPNQNESHPRSMEIWQSARPDETNSQTGWLGRALDETCVPTDATVPAVYVGRFGRPFAFSAERVFVPTVRRLRDCTLQPITASPDKEGDRRRLARAAEIARSEKDNQLLSFLQKSTVAARATSRKIEEIADRPAASAGYPPFELAQLFQTVVRLIRADVGIRIYYTEVGGGSPGGFDNHANQRDNHAALLRELSESVAALVDDLKRDRLLDRVMLMTFSEFGRTLAENGRRGTGHGEAAPMFLVGGGALRKGGLVGPHPSLKDLRNGSPKFHTDFRRVYATLLDRWLGFDSQAVLGQRFEPLDV